VPNETAAPNGGSDALPNLTRDPMSGWDGIGEGRNAREQG